MPNYKTVADYLVDRQARDLANQTRQVVCLKLEIKEPELRWIVKDEFGPKWFEQDVAGFCSKGGDEIFIHRDLKPFSIANTVVHEARHCWQIRNPRRYPIPNKTYTRDMNQSQKERDARIFELEFWSGREKQDGSFVDIEHVLTGMQIESARAALQAASRQYGLKPQRSLPYSTSASYPSQVKMRLVVPTDREMEESLLRYILNG